MNTNENEQGNPIVALVVTVAVLAFTFFGFRAMVEALTVPPTPEEMERRQRQRAERMRVELMRREAEAARREQFFKSLDTVETQEPDMFRAALDTFFSGGSTTGLRTIAFYDGRRTYGERPRKVLHVRDPIVTEHMLFLPTHEGVEVRYFDTWGAESTTIARGSEMTVFGITIAVL